jgi:TonB family protein
VPKVLIVSEADLAPALGETIVWGRDVERVFASSSASALDVARAYVPSLVVLDGTDEPATLRLIRQLREHPGTRRSSIVVVAASPGPSPGEETLQGGANLVLPSPVDPAQWDARLARLLAVPTRLRIRFPVQIRRRDLSGEAIHAAHALDLSVTGMLVESETPVPAGEAVELRFKLPGTDEELRGAACVVRSSRGAPACLGLSFRRLEGEAVERIRTLLASVPVARAFGRYEALGPLGEGSMGCVYRAFDPVAQRVVAIKTLRPELLGSPQAHEYLQRFRREAQAAAKLAHPNIVTIFDVGEDYFVMELLEGRTLQQLLREAGRLDLEAVCGILGPVARALDHAHSQGAIHRDVKPANVMIAPDGRPTVMDFGVVHLVSGSITGTGQVFGSPFYMAPEQISQSQSGASPQTDIFSLGVVAYEALTGRKPFEGEGITPILYHVVHTDPPAASSLNPDLGPHHDRVLQRALAKDPGLRFTTATAFVEALFSGANHEALPVRPTSASVGPVGADPADPRVETQDLGPEVRPFRTRVSRRRAGIAVAALAAAAIAAGFGLRRPRPDAEVQATAPGLSITTTPSGATVWLDGEEVGTTPLFLTKVAPAAHRVRVAATGYVPTELTVRTTDEATLMPIRLILQAATGTLEVDSEPGSARVHVDGEERGATPFSDTRMGPGTHRVLVELPGHRPFSKTVEVRSGETERLVAHLERSTDMRSEADELRQKGWVRVGDLVALGPGVTPPWRISGEAARYPESARRLGIEGTVAVALTVSEEGEVLDTRVVESAGDVLDQALLTAVRTWRYEPAESNGVKVRVRIVERQSFTRAR